MHYRLTFYKKSKTGQMMVVDELKPTQSVLSLWLGPKTTRFDFWVMTRNPNPPDLPPTFGPHIYQYMTVNSKITDHKTFRMNVFGNRIRSLLLE